MSCFFLLESEKVTKHLEEYSQINNTNILNSKFYDWNIIKSLDTV